MLLILHVSIIEPSGFMLFILTLLNQIAVSTGNQEPFWLIYLQFKWHSDKLKAHIMCIDNRGTHSGVPAFQ